MWSCFHSRACKNWCFIIQEMTFSTYSGKLSLQRTLDILNRNQNLWRESCLLKEERPCGLVCTISRRESLILSTDRDHSDLVPYYGGKTLYPGIWLWDKQTIRKTRRIAQGNLSSTSYDIILSYFMLNKRRISGWMNKKLKYLVLCDLRQHLRMSSADFSSKPVQWVSLPSGIVKISK